MPKNSTPTLLQRLSGLSCFAADSVPPFAMSELKLDNTYVSRIPWSWLQLTQLYYLISLGAILIGVIVAAALWGGTHSYNFTVISPKVWPRFQVSCVQVWYYYNHYPKDAWYLKRLVCISQIQTYMLTSIPSGSCCLGDRHCPPNTDIPHKYVKPVYASRV